MPRKRKKIYSYDVGRKVRLLYSYPCECLPVIYGVFSLVTIIIKQESIGEVVGYRERSLFPGQFIHFVKFGNYVIPVYFEEITVKGV